jgi:hypothetical protein
VSALVLGMVLGAVLQYALPRAWKEATEADRREQLRARPAGRSAVDRPAQLRFTLSRWWTRVTARWGSR